MPQRGIMPVILVKLIMVPVAACRGGSGDIEELADLGPGELLVAAVVDGLGQELLGLGVTSHRAGRTENRR